MVEVLVIVAVIALLAAMCPCSCGSAREKARRANCMNNLKQVGLGIAQYCDDYTNMPPMGTMRVLAGSIAPYIGHSQKLFHCPSDKNPFTAMSISNLTRTSYIAFSGVVWQVGMAPLASDKFDMACPISVFTGKQGWTNSSPHGVDGGNVLWTDGHVSWQTSLDVGTNRHPVVND